MHAIDSRWIQILDSISDRLILLDKDQRIVWANRAALAYVSVELKDVINKQSSILWGEIEDHDEATFHDDLDIENKGVLKKLIDTKDGYTWLVTATPVVVDGSIEYISEIWHDVTENMIKDSELTKLNDRLKISNKKLYLTNVELEAANEELTAMNASLDTAARTLAQTLSELKESETRFDLAVKGSSDGLWDIILGEDGKYWYSDRVYEIFGYTPDTVPRNLKDVMDIFHPDDRQKLIDARNRHLTTGEPYVLEARIRNAAGEYRWTVQRGQALWNEEGVPIRMSGSLQDIHEKKLFEEELAHERKRYEGILKTAVDGIFSVSKEGIIIECNDAFCNLVGYSKDELIGKHITFVDIDETLEITKAHTEDIQNKGTDKFIRKYKKKDGNIVDVEISTSCIDIGDEGFLSAFCRDISDRLSYEEELKKSRERLELTLWGAELGTWDWNIKTGRAAFDKRWAEIIGYNLSEVESDVSFWERNVHEEDLASVLKSLNDCLEGITGCYESEHRMKHKDGHWVWILDKGMVIERDEQGNPIRMCGTHLDITKRKTEEIERESLLNKLNMMISEIKTLTGMLPICSHCKKIRDDKGYWKQIESYISEHSDAQFSHALCPECAQKFYPEIFPEGSSTKD